VTAIDARFAIAVGDFRLEAELALERGVLVLFGPSGAGKSVTLRALAGLLTPERGTIRVGGDVLFDRAGGVAVPAHRRRIGYVPQHSSLFPFCSVEANVAFGLPRHERRRGSQAVAELMAALGVAALRDARPATLSGGERQRVALARALAVRPRLMLLDEPFASIDRPGRAALRETLKEVLARYQTPAVLVTHDPEEAAHVGDVLVRYERGRTLPAEPAREQPGA
jgi:molybdate transport system ATP-binding protein